MEAYIVRIYRRKVEHGGLFAVMDVVGLVGLLRGDPPDERRRAERLRLFVPATVEGTDISGKPFSEEIVIEELNPHGAGFRMQARVLVGDELRLRIAPDSGGLRRQARVVSIAQAPEPRIVGVEFR